jgi:hypothetical protein
MPVMTGVCKVGIEGAAMLLDRSSYILSSHEDDRNKRARVGGEVLEGSRFLLPQLLNVCRLPNEALRSRLTSMHLPSYLSLDRRSSVND